MSVAHRVFASGIARRTLACFIVAALLPLAMTAVLSLDQVSGLLTEQSHARLARSGDDYANALHDRLLTAIERLKDWSSRREVGASRREADRTRLQREFKAIGVVDQSGRVVSAVGEIEGAPTLDAAQVDRLGRGGTIVTGVAGAKGTMRVFVSAAHDSAPGRRAVAEIDPAYLWGRPVDPSTRTGICVGDARGNAFFCTADAAATALQLFASQMREGVTGRDSFDQGGITYIASHHPLVLEPEIAGRGWSVIATRPMPDVLAPLAELESTLLAMAAVAALIVAVLSITQICRALRAVDLLQEGARRIGGRDFSARVDVDGNDEFGQLGASFNTMAARLGGEFNAMLTLSDIDQAIVSRLDLDRVIETVLVRMRDVVPADFVSIAIADRNAPAMVRIYTRDQREGGGLELERCAFSAEDTDVLLAYPDGLWLDRAQAVTPYLAPVAKLGATSLLVLPIVWQNAVVGTVVLGFHAAAVLTDEQRGRARNLGDRVGVAFATAAKDEQLYVRANYDALTALPNRQYFMDQLARRLAQANREGRQFALLVVDLDHFKRINDTLGHEAGDDVLRQTAERLKQCVRETDTVTRLGGDEFTIVLPQIKTARDSESVAQHIIESMAAPFVVGGQEQFLNASIGIALYPADGTTAEELLRNADTAMYRAKEGGRGRYVYFEERMNVAALARISLERELRLAMEKNQFSLWYQPQLDLRTGRISGAEALLRWEVSDREIRKPAEFIHLAEETGLIEPIGEWVLTEACRQFRAWQSEGVELPRLSVNMSIRQFRQPAFVDRVRAILLSTGMPPECLELEITEGLLHETNRAAAALIEPLHALGLGFSLDDFGAGYASLASLKRFPLATVKIDRTFVADLVADDESGSVAAAIIATAHALRKRVVAEGVETERQAAILARLGCDHLQGHFCGRPLNARNFAQYLMLASAGAPKKPRAVTLVAGSGVNATRPIR